MDNKLLKRLSVHSLIYTQLYKTEVSEAQHSDQEHARRRRGRQRPHSRAHPSAQRSPRKAARPTRSRRLGRQRAKSAAPTSMAAGGQQPSRRWGRAGQDRTAPRRAPPRPLRPRGCRAGAGARRPDGRAAVFLGLRRAATGCKTTRCGWGNVNFSVFFFTKYYTKLNYCSKFFVKSDAQGLKW